MSRRSPSPEPTQAHPWITATAPEAVQESLEPDPLWRHAVLLDGPSSPQAAPHVEVSPDEGWPTFELTRDASVCVMGLHGGAGATTLTHLLGSGATDTDQRWPVYAGWTRPVPNLAVVAVARTNHTGLEAVERFARLWAADALPSSTLISLVLIDDGPKLLKDQERAVQRVSRLLPKNGHIGWQETWRLAQPSYQSSPARVRKLVDQIKTLASSTNGAQQ